ncbi:MAG: PQQ-like beta-propeller repeat protein, partial [Candidatus Hydrogenedentes bacterium]|nr:PQQ-like beta-propeller repeat protein [Candidatus Hydrogenedentota bacterium]
MLRFVFVVGMVCASVVNANEVEQVWAYEAPAGYVDASPALGDLDGDGKMDIVVGTTAGIIAAITSDAKEIWHQEMRGPICVAPSIGDIASSSGLEVLAMNQQGEIVCFAGSSGDLLWTATLPNKLYWGETTLALGDVTGDGNLEIVTGDGSGTVICLNGDGETLWLYKGDHGMTLSPVIVDLTGDGVQSILVGGDKIPLVCLSAAGKELWRSESGIGSSSLVYDLDGDSVPEILVGVDENFTVRDNTGKILWTYVMQREMDSAITVADADANGEVEIYVVDLAGTLVCLSPEGQLRWSADVVDRVRRSPSVGDVNGDGIQEILVVGYSNFLYAFDPDGGLKASIPISGGVNSTATLIPMADGVPGVILPVSNGIMSLFRWSEAQPNVPLLWPEYRFSARRSGNPQASAMSPPVEIELDVDTMYAGANFLKAAIQNPEGRLVEVRLESVRNAGVPFVVSITSSEKFIEHQLSYTVPSNQAINLTLSCTVLENNRILAKRNHTAYLPPFMKELGDASRAAAETEALLPRLLDK